ncbi:protease pro-enzyme activation domain-containing protein [Lentilactobacillus sp. Marseille-Q4993]|uniref:S53 family peptidase n=1 Tax=Lentilactobacillus sp. Marseille-Q4993 TaxID=3039492 RepID=UPI0024BD4EE1|nr:protease pro-enzyme activation domain-containing protein [Lentilactobacillus sp. Marseille-Q4993]
MKKFSLLFGTAALALMAGGQLSANAASNDTTSISVVLKSRDSAGLQNYVYNTVDPSSPDYKQYLTPTQFATKFGQPDSVVDQYKKLFSKYKVKTTARPGNLTIKVTGKYSNIVKALKAKPSHKTGKYKTVYTLPKSLKSKTAAVIGLYTQQPKKKKATTTKPKSKLQIHSHADLNTETKPDTSLSDNEFSKQYGAAKFTNRYHLDDLYKQGHEGQGQSVGVITLVDFHNSDVKHYLDQIGVNDDMSRVTKYYANESKTIVAKDLNKKKTGAKIAAQGEATLDVNQATSVAPKAHVNVYVGADPKNKNQNDHNYFNTFAQAVTGNRDRQITTSFAVLNEIVGNPSGFSETPKQYTDAFNILFQQAAAQGITIFNASGDNGARDKPSSKVNLGIVSPFAVQVGGTTLPYQRIINGKLINVTKERAWGDDYTMSAKEVKNQQFGASGGGFSVLNPLPRFQQGVSGIGTFRAANFVKYDKSGKGSLNKNAAVFFGTHTGYNVPDVAANADPKTGYAIYVTSGNPSGKHESKWYGPSGGTSFAAPQVAAANAVMNSGLSSSTGFWGPQIYKYAQQDDSPFTPLDDADNNNNLYYTGQPGKLYNQATGLGTIDFGKLFTKFSNK